MHQNGIFTFFENSLRYNITTRRIWICSWANFCIIYKNCIGIYNRAEPKPSFIIIEIFYLLRRKFNFFFKPNKPRTVKLIDKSWNFNRLPSFIIARIFWILPQFCIPFCLIFSQFFLFCSNIFIFFIDFKSMDIFVCPHLLQRGFTHPCRNRRTTLTRIYNTNWNVQFLRKFFRKEISCSRHLTDCRRRSCLPNWIFNVITLTMKSPRNWNCNHADIWIFWKFKFFWIWKTHAFHWKLSIWLTWIHPNFTNVNIIKSNIFLFRFYQHIKRTASLPRTEFNFPVSSFICLSNRSHSSKSHINIFIGSGSSKNTVNLILLQNHSRGNNSFYLKFSFHSKILFSIGSIQFF